MSKLNELLNDSDFWAIITKIGWDGDDERCRSKVIDMINTSEILRPGELKLKYKYLCEQINKVTEKRLKDGKSCFADDVISGGDDCHFMDLPGELIGRGKEEVEKYLSGEYIVPYSARECFHYAFQCI